MNTLLKLLTIIVLFLYVIELYSQKNLMKFGKIDENELKMTKYSKETTANALMLGNYGNAFFKFDNDKGFQLVVEIRTRIKILSEAS